MRGCIVELWWQIMNKPAAQHFRSICFPRIWGQLIKTIIWPLFLFRLSALAARSRASLSRCRSAASRWRSLPLACISGASPPAPRFERCKSARRRARATKSVNLHANSWKILSISELLKTFIDQRKVRLPRELTAAAAIEIAIRSESAERASRITGIYSFCWLSHLTENGSPRATEDGGRSTGARLTLAPICNRFSSATILLCSHSDIRAIIEKHKTIILYIHFAYSLFIVSA